MTAAEDTPGPISGSAEGTRRILIFGVLRMEVMIAKGNPWQLEGYGAYFDEVHVGYLLGNQPKRMDKGRTRLVSLGTSSRLIDALLAPWHLYRYARHVGGFDVYQTPDVVFSWWTTLLIRWLLGARVLLVPVSLPEQLYKDSGHSMSGLPIWVERLMIRASYSAAHRVLTGHSFGSFVQLLGANPLSRHKLVVVQMLPDALIADAFITGTHKAPLPRSPDGVFTLVCVSRLHHEKLLEDLVDLMQVLKSRGLDGKRIRLRLIGGGPLEAELRQRIATADVGDQLELVGAVPNQDLVGHLLAADVFVSPLTGSSLREAMFCRLPVVAYDRDWVSGLLVHDEHALLVGNRDIEGLADAVQRLMADEPLRQKIGRDGRLLALRLWSLEGCEEACRAIHEASLAP